MSLLCDELITLRDWLRWAVSRFTEAELYFGHGCDNAYDEAIWLILHTLHLPQDRLEPFLDARLTQEERRNVHDILHQRIAKRLPAAYLTKEAWLGHYRFHVDARVIVPRSYFANVLEENFAPWIEDPEQIGSALDMCTGSGCLAILMAMTFPNATIDAIDLSPDALAVARQNIAEYGFENRVSPIESNLFDALKTTGKRYDLIISNPPYVTQESMSNLPAEYRHEPAMALAAGDDGLDIVHRLIAESGRHLNPGGLLAVEVGHNRHLVEAAYPELPLTWIDTADGEEKIFIIHREQLPLPH